ncbi:ATP-binding protein [Pseudomonas sp. GL-B-26]|uniref:ATP-binding protein n=1 Tax=unclassified Pseudomonas TaxID=196821 RepID=UPI001CBF7543|nr:ATP-binding protein [Pseudomonas sp. GL-B-26]
MSSIGYVVSSSPTSITIEINGLEDFEKFKSELQVGKFLKIEDGNHNFAVASIKNISGQHVDKDGKLEWKFIIESAPAGALMKNDNGEYVFSRGTQVLPVPTEKVHVFEAVDLDIIFSRTGNYNYKVGTLSNNKAIEFHVDGDKFFGKHIGIVGSTGSGKSCTVARILHNAIGINNNENLNQEIQKNSHIIIFDMHSEYASAFTMHESQKFNLNLLNVDGLKLPYWLMNSEELESLFIEGSEQGAHNQISQFKKAVILNKEKYNTGLTSITYDTPVYFSITEVFNYINNKNNLTTYEKDGNTYLATLATPKQVYSEECLWDSIEFEQSSGNGKHATIGEKVSKDGGFNGEFDRFVSRLETKLHDKRLEFLLKPTKATGAEYETKDFEDILKQFLGYLEKSNVTIVDLSGIPFEVLSITVSLISRLVFDFAFHYSKLKHKLEETNNVPFMIVCEEAHNYIPRSNNAEFKASKKSIERIAKEGRKYGLSLMVVSQRPSEVSDTIFSQCSNFISLRLTNTIDQGYIKALLPDSANGLVDLLPSLAQGEALIVGDAVLMPSLVRLKKPSPEPKSASVNVFTEWNTNWQEVVFETVIERWQKQDTSAS